MEGGAALRSLFSLENTGNSDPVIGHTASSELEAGHTARKTNAVRGRGRVMK
jgi:hypothetical protein